MKRYFYQTGLLALTLLIGSPAEADTRTWTNSSGTKIEGELRGIKDGKAQLLVKGRLFEVSVESLSESDQKFLKDSQSGKAAEDKATEATASSPILQAMKGNLVKADGRKLKSHEVEEPGKIEYVAFYSSASWCGPCHAFTPDLARKYKSLKKKYDNFELVLLSADKNEKDWEGYVEEYKMPWPALKFSASSEKGILKSGSKSRFIPAIHIVKIDGTVLEDGTAGASNSLEKLEDILKESGAE